MWISDRGARLSSTLPELMTIMRGEGIEPALDAAALADVVTFGTPLGRRTLIGEVVRLHPGEEVVPGQGADSPGVEILPPRDPEGPGLASDDREGWIASYLERLREALARRIDGPGTLGCALSGGLDSRTLLALLRALGATPVAVNFGNAGHPDREVATAVAKKAGVDLLTAELPPDGPLPHLDEIAAMTGGTGNLALLAGLPSHTPMAERIDFLVSGASGDALFGPLPPVIPDDPKGLRAALPPLRDDRRRALLPDAPEVEERLEEAAAFPTPASSGDAARLAHLMRWRQATVIADGVRMRTIHTPVVAPFLEPGPRALAAALPAELREGRDLQRTALQRLAPDLASLPLVPGPPPGTPVTRATHYLRGRADHLARNLWLRGTPDRGALFDIQTALRRRPRWREAMERLCASPPPGVDPRGLRRLWRRHLRGRDNLGLLFGRLLVTQRFVERWLRGDGRTGRSG